MLNLKSMFPIASRIEKLSDDEVVAECLDVLRRIYRDKDQVSLSSLARALHLQHDLTLYQPNAPICSYVTRWQSDEFALGSYSYFAPKSRPVDMDILSASVGDCLHFAGEATNRTHPASTHGAVLSGRREAEKIIKHRAGLLNLDS